MVKHTPSCHIGLRLLLCSNIRLSGTLLDVQLAAIEFAAASKSSSVHTPAQEGLPSAGRLHTANGESGYSSPLTAQSFEQDADPWGSLVDPESPGMPSLARADASSPPCHTEDLISCQPPGQMQAAQEPCRCLDAGQQPEQATSNPELIALSSSEDVVAGQISFELKDCNPAVHSEFGGQQQHSAGSNNLKWELVMQQKQAASAGRQLQWQLQESQQHLLHCQENHKQRIAAAFGQIVKAEVADQPRERPQKQQAGAKLAAGPCQISNASSRAEQQEQQQKQLQLKCPKQAKHAQQRFRAGPEQDAAEAETEVGCNLGNMYRRVDTHSGKLPDVLTVCANPLRKLHVQVHIPFVTLDALAVAVTLGSHEASILLPKSTITDGAKSMQSLTF